MADESREQAGDGQCPECGAANDPSDLVCASCGAALENSASRALIGQVVLSVYQISDVLGQGGMSVVYKARHKLTDQVVALKILPAELAAHAAVRTRFLEEAKALARLEHPNIVRLYHFGEEGGRFVLAMQFVEGVTFERKIFKQKRMAWREATQITCELLRALEYAHEAGVVHRDIKPSNVIVRTDNTAMVMDFGIAKITRESSRLTSTGQTMGTVRYMSPEQVRGQVVDFKSDIYSTGVTLFEAVVGDTPFDGNTHFEIMTKHLNEAPPTPRSMGADIPASLEEVILRALVKDPAGRWESASQFLRALEAVLAGDPAQAGLLRAAAPTAQSQVTTPVESHDGVGAESRITGIASTLEPSMEEPVVAAARPRSKAWLWALLGAVVVAGGATALWLTRGNTKGDGVAAGKPAGGQGADEWPEPLLVPGFVAQVDQRFAEPERVRVLSYRPIDAAHVARTYLAARQAFEKHLAKAGVGAAVEVKPLNLVVAPAALMCQEQLYAPRPPPEACGSEPPRFHHRPEQMTLYVLDSESMETINLPEGASAHLCRTTQALLEIGCSKKLLPAFWDEVEGKGTP